MHTQTATIRTMNRSFPKLLSSPIRLGSRAAGRRSYAAPAAGAPSFQVFNRRVKWLQKERAAADVESSRQSDYLKDEVASRLCERLLVRALLLRRMNACTRRRC